MARCYVLRPIYTPGRHARLAEVEAAGDAGAPRARGPVGFQCMRLGWTQWARPLAADSRELLTAEGMRVLEDWNEHYGRGHAPAGARVR